MKKLASILLTVSIICFLLTIICVAIFTVIEYASSFLLAGFNFVHISSLLLKVMYVLFAISVVSFVFSCILDKV